MQKLLIDAATEIAPYLIQAIIAAIAAATAYFHRKRVQLAAAVEATTAVEVRAQQGDLPKDDKKTVAMELVAAKLRNPLVRPLSFKGLDQLVERAVPAARERARASLTPPPPAGTAVAPTDEEPLPPAA